MRPAAWVEGTGGGGRVRASAADGFARSLPGEIPRRRPFRTLLLPAPAPGSTQSALPTHNLSVSPCGPAAGPVTKAYDCVHER